MLNRPLPPPPAEPDPMRAALMDMVGYLQERAVVVATLDQRMIVAEVSLRKFDRIVTDGNGNPSVIAQLATIHSEQKQMANDVMEINARMTEMVRNAYTAKILLASSLITGVAAIVAAFLTRH